MDCPSADRLFTYPYERFPATWGGTVKVTSLLEMSHSRRRYNVMITNDNESVDVNSEVHVFQDRHELPLLIGKCYSLQGSVICSEDRRITTLWLEERDLRNPRSEYEQRGILIHGKGMVLSDIAFEGVGIEPGWRIAIIKHREQELSSLTFVEFEMEYLYTTEVRRGIHNLTRGDIVTIAGTVIGKEPGAQMWLSELYDIIVNTGGSARNRVRPKN
ncbi:hypothetical protein DFH28DRAFT_937988 [Melampsora americana]|nr:hypothetical protein DFH28DRAFT_937988 [Melampsora americana]